MNRVHTLRVLLIGSMVVGCGRSETKASPSEFPRFGLAVSDSVRAWCAEFLSDSTAPPLEPGQGMTIVFAGPASVASLPARLGQPHAGECPAAFPQPRWNDYVAYRVELVSAREAEDDPIVALIVAGSAAWARGADGRPRADLDGDGNVEEVRRCTADEGEHFTVWSGPNRRWHEYYDWGGFTDPTCRTGENGRDDSTTSHSQGR